MQIRISQARLAVIYIISAAVGLPIVFVSLGKLLLVITALICLMNSVVGQKDQLTFVPALTVKWILVSLFAMTLSIAWSTAPNTEAYSSFAKYGKLILIALLPMLIRSRREGLLALTVFVAAQAFLLLSSWMLFLQLPTPWAVSDMAHTHYAVFSSYLDQSIMSAVFAAVCWHLRPLLSQRWHRSAAVLVAMAAVINVFFVLEGRSGHLVAIAMLSMAMMWALPKKYRLLVILLPFLIALGTYAGSVKVRERANLMIFEASAYGNDTNRATSTGIRLGFWSQAIHIIKAHPWTGTGAGSWSTEYNQLERARNTKHVDIAENGNPHQEYLLWGVQLGVPGLLLFCTLIAAMFRDSFKLEGPFKRTTQSVIVAFAVACMFNSSLYDALIGDFFCVLLGLLFAFEAARTRQSLHSSDEQLQPVK